MSIPDQMMPIEIEYVVDLSGHCDWTTIPVKDLENRCRHWSWNSVVDTVSHPHHAAKKTFPLRTSNAKSRELSTKSCANQTEKNCHHQPPHGRIRLWSIDQIQWASEHPNWCNGPDTWLLQSKKVLGWVPRNLLWKWVRPITTTDGASNGDRRSAVSEDVGIKTFSRQHQIP